MGLHQFFVDEAGDLTLFDARGRVIVGTPGVSHTFAVGAALIADVNGLSQRLATLRSELLTDPYFQGVPSMQLANRKTALAFHAKDDLAEVRREVFRVLVGEDVKMFAAFRRKRGLASEYRSHFDRTGIKRDPEEPYDHLVEHIFKDRLHLADENRIVFARRGKSHRAEALARSIERAKGRFERRWQKGIDRPTVVESGWPHHHAGLQAVDYLLWALQRLLERKESRFFDLVASKFALVLDIDDKREHGFGVYYSSRNPLNLTKILPVVEARPGSDPGHTA
jgi:hypothetical protein